MTEIFNFGVEQSQRYAHDQQEIIEFRKKYKVDPGQVSFIDKHTKILSKTTAPPQIEILLGINSKITWARFTPPLGYFDEHPRPEFLIGSPEKLDGDIKRCTATMQQAYEQAGAKEGAELPGQSLLNVLVEIQHYNELLSSVRASMNAFVKG